MLLATPESIEEAHRIKQTPSFVDGLLDIEGKGDALVDAAGLRAGRGRAAMRTASSSLT